MTSSTSCRLALAALIGACLVLVACETGSPGACSTAMNESGAAKETIADIMRAKLTHANALLQAITYEDFEQIDHEATALTWLSRRSEWRVHETVAYAAFSDDFRESTELVAERAREHDIDGVSSAYAAMTANCMRCHNYLREENLYRDMPGARTQSRPARPWRPDDQPATARTFNVRPTASSIDRSSS